MKADFQKAFTLVETLVVVALFLLIMSTVYSIYMLNQKAYKESESLAELSQNGRVVMERVIREVRQAKKIMTVLPAGSEGAPSEIQFLDGHVPMVKETGFSMGGDAGSIVLSPSASIENDYYKDLFITIISGTGSGQTRKIYGYNGSSRTAQVNRAWEIVPDMASEYIIDSSFYYVKYYSDPASKTVLRADSAFCLSYDGANCAQPLVFVEAESIPLPGQSVIEKIFEEPQTIGEFAASLKFWGDTGLITVYLQEERGGQSALFQSKVFGRNL